MTQPIKWLIALTNGGFTLIDKSDFEALSVRRWYRDSLGYVRSYDGNGKYTYIHRMIFPGNAIVDHKNGDKTDNRRCNLRSATKAQNSHNSKAHRDKSSSRFKGVTFDKARSRWAADIMANGIRKRLGRFHTEAEAVSAYRVAAMELHGEFANVT